MAANKIKKMKLERKQLREEMKLVDEQLNAKKTLTMLTEKKLK